MDTVPASVKVADFALLVWFCVECNVHITAEGDHPQCYFFGRESESWSLPARWNVFDFSVSYASLLLATVISETGESSYRIVVLLRLLRLARLATILNKSPEMAVIVAGFVSAVNSVFYILIVSSMTRHVLLKLRCWRSASASCHSFTLSFSSTYSSDTECFHVCTSFCMYQCRISLLTCTSMDWCRCSWWRFTFSRCLAWTSSVEMIRLDSGLCPWLCSPSFRLLPSGNMLYDTSDK
jgi:hypothetical protein